MENAHSAKFLVAQLGSIVQYLERRSGGMPLTFEDIDMMKQLNAIIKDCVVLQKGIKLEKAKPQILGMIEGYVSGAEYARLKIVLDNLHPSYSVSRQRVARVAGTTDINWEFDITAVAVNVGAIYENLRKMLEDAPGTAQEIQDPILYSIEAASEVIDRIIMQEHLRLRSFSSRS